MFGFLRSPFFGFQKVLGWQSGFCLWWDDWDDLPEPAALQIVSVENDR